MDTHYLLALYEIMQLQLDGKVYSDACVEESICLTKREWNGRRFDGEDFLRIKKAHTLSKVSLRVLRVLYEARDDLGKQDVPFFIMPQMEYCLGSHKIYQMIVNHYRVLFNPNMLVWCPKSQRIYCGW